MENGGYCSPQQKPVGDDSDFLENLLTASNFYADGSKSDSVWGAEIPLGEAACDVLG